jgi:preprotein translocase subunit Sec61beta
MTIGADGLGLISYFDSGHLKVTHCSDTTCSAASTATLANGDLYTSVTIGADGLGLISYFDSGHLEVAHCSNTACSAASNATLDSAGVGM